VPPQHVPVATSQGRLVYAQQQVSFLPPQGSDWYFLPSEALRSPQFVGFFKRLRDTPPQTAEEVRSVVAIAALLDRIHLGAPADAKLETAEDLERLVEQLIQLRPSTPRRRIVGATADVDRARGAECIRYEEQIEDVGVPRFPGAVFVERQRGVRCLHPRLPGRVVDLGYSERHLKGQEFLALDAELEPFVESLQYPAGS
jgi:hypothetical protein